MTFDPRRFIEDGVAIGPLARPRFFPIVSSNALATMMLRRANGRIDGFIVEGTDSRWPQRAPTRVGKTLASGRTRVRPT